jgi:hypothetical protein
MSVSTSPDANNLSFASAFVRWHVRSMLGPYGAQLDGDVFTSGHHSFTAPPLLYPVPFGISYSWKLTDGTSTVLDQGRAPDFAVVGYTEALLVQATSSGDATATADFSHSAALTAVLFADGSTPESHGIDLYFLSGQTSPNLQSAAVPEPASLVLWGLGALGCAAAGYRRRRGGAGVSPVLVKAS